MTRIALIAGLASTVALGMSAFTAQAAPYSPTAPTNVKSSPIEQVYYRGGYHRRPVVVVPLWRGNRGHHYGHGRHWR